MKIKYSLDFDSFPAAMGVALMDIFSNQVEFDAIFQLCSTSLFSPITHLNPDII